jgi:hypothetical protein
MSIWVLAALWKISFLEDALVPSCFNNNQRFWQKLLFWRQITGWVAAGCILILQAVPFFGYSWGTGFIFQIRRRREASPTTSSSITLCRNNSFWFSVGITLFTGCEDCTSSSLWQRSKLRKILN